MHNIVGCLLDVNKILVNARYYADSYKSWK